MGHADMTAQPEGAGVLSPLESETTPSPVSAARLELGLGAPRSEDEAQLAALVDLAESILPIPRAWRTSLKTLP